VTDNLAGLRGKRLLVLNWRDIRHSQAGGAEFYMHEIARRWVATGIRVTWLTARESGAPSLEIVDGITIHRAGGALGVYSWTAVRLLVASGQYDAVVDCQNGIPFFAPLFTRRRMPVIQVVHHVHQDQFATRFSPAMASLGRFLEDSVSRRVYAGHALAAVSASTRQELRDRLKVRAPIFVVPNGTADRSTVAGERSLDPSVAVVNRLVPHKRLDLLLNHLGAVACNVPRLRVHIVGDGPELLRLQRQAVVLGLSETVVFHGYQPDRVRDALLREAWLTVSVSAAEGWGCSVVEAAAFGVPCLGLNVPGIRDSVVHDRTGWLIESGDDVAAAMTRALHQLSDDRFAAQLAAQCRQWAECFDWDRSAELLAGVVTHEMQTQRLRQSGMPQARVTRTDLATVVTFPTAAGAVDRSDLHATDQVSHRDGTTSLLLIGCDEVGAHSVLQRLGIRRAEVRLATRHDVLAGPGALPSTTPRLAREAF
jgi:glycosyltransferase involved in cell wall biosynthesis